MGSTGNENSDTHRIFSSMTRKRAEGIINNIDLRNNYSTRREFVEHLAALVTCNPEVARKKNTSGRTIEEILISACSPSRFQWLLNWARLMQQTENQNRLVPPSTGTTGNEALHSQIRRTLRSVVQMHQSTLRLKCKIFQLKKTILHQSSAYSPLTTTNTESYLSHRLFNATNPWSCSVTMGYMEGKERNISREFLAGRITLQSKVRSATSRRKLSEVKKASKRTTHTKPRSSAAVAITKG